MQSIIKIIPTIMLLVFALLSSDFFASLAIAGEREMTCKNPRRAYQVIFDDKANTLKLKTPGKVTSYKVMRVDNTTTGLVIAGKPVTGGPDFAAYFGRDKRIEFIADGSTIQTDKCK